MQNGRATKKIVRHQCVGSGLLGLLPVRDGACPKVTAPETGQRPARDCRRSRQRANNPRWHMLLFAGPNCCDGERGFWIGAAVSAILKSWGDCLDSCVVLLRSRGVHVPLASTCGFAASIFRSCSGSGPCWPGRRLQRPLRILRRLRLRLRGSTGAGAACRCNPARDRGRWPAVTDSAADACAQAP